MMRRKDRETSRDAAEAVIDACPYGVLSTVSPEGTPYGVPVSLVREGEWLYFHGAKEGQKVDNINARNTVCVTCVGAVKVIENAFSVAYESAVVFGTVQEVRDDPEKIRCLRLLCLRHTPANMDAFDEAVRRSLEKTGVWKIHIDRISGKQRRDKP